MHRLLVCTRLGPAVWFLCVALLFLAGFVGAIGEFVVGCPNAGDMCRLPALNATARLVHFGISVVVSCIGLVGRSHGVVSSMCAVWHMCAGVDHVMRPSQCVVVL